MREKKRMIGVDTSTLIDLFKGSDSLVKLLATIKEPIFLNRVIYLELLFGLDPENEKHKKEDEFYYNLFSSFPNLELDFFSSKKTKEIFWGLKKRGKLVGLFDCVIAGIYLNGGVDKIITKNVGHFENIEGLEVISY